MKKKKIILDMDWHIRTAQNGGTAMKLSIVMKSNLIKGISTSYLYFCGFMRGHLFNHQSYQKYSQLERTQRIVRREKRYVKKNKDY